MWLHLHLPLKHLLLSVLMAATAIAVQPVSVVAQALPQNPEQVCIAIERALIFGEPASGELPDNSSWRFTKDRSLSIARSGVVTSTQNDFGFESRQQCIAKVTALVDERECTITIVPAKSFPVTRRSPEMGGGYCRLSTLAPRRTQCARLLLRRRDSRLSIGYSGRQLAHTERYPTSGVMF